MGEHQECLQPRKGASGQKTLKTMFVKCSSLGKPLSLCIITPLMAVPAASDLTQHQGTTYGTRQTKCNRWMHAIDQRRPCL